MYQQLLLFLCHLGIMSLITFSRYYVKQSPLAGLHEGVIKLVLGAVE